MVALRKESVDRNLPKWGHRKITFAVALRKESVDRNVGNSQGVGIVTVALRKESVDRNYGAVVTFQDPSGSLSARRAWIEISASLAKTCEYVVALRKESVDRNHVYAWMI